MTYESKYQKINNTSLPLLAIPRNGEIFNNYSSREIVNGVERKALLIMVLKSIIIIFQDSIKTIAIGYNLMSTITCFSKRLKKWRMKSLNEKVQTP
ncbi:MAG: hypothetical protein R2783_08410 [Gelidibacter sp.]